MASRAHAALLLLCIAAAAAGGVHATTCSQYNQDVGCKRCDDSGEECREWCDLTAGGVSADAHGRCHSCPKLTRDPYCSVCFMPHGVNPATGRIECKECWAEQPNAADPFLIVKSSRGRCVGCPRCRRSDGWATADEHCMCLTCSTADGYLEQPVGGRCVLAPPAP